MESIRRLLQYIHEPITYASMKEIGVETIAEGIETEAQLKAWLELGCEYGQGWLWGKAKAIA
jgi:EAL domain-containing protein (putative c-di-GMP-specific phosphodiesterase class I)